MESVPLFLILYAAQWIALVFLLAFVLGAYNQIGVLDHLVRTGQQPPSVLNQGDRLPAALRATLPSHAFVVLVSQGCGACISLMQRLKSIELGGWRLTIVVMGAHAPTPGAKPLPDALVFPTGAQVIYDPQGAWLRALRTYGTPAALAFVGGRLVDQKVSPDIGWFGVLAATPDARWVKESVLATGT